MSETENGRITSGLAVGILILNLIIPGVGTLIAGNEYKNTGIYQLVLWVIGVITTVIFAGYLLTFAAWVWALVTSIEILKKAS